MIRAYKDEDKTALIEMLRLNTPQYFDPTEEAEYVSYLQHELEYYYVFEEEGVVVGCGGINYIEEENLFRISWDMVHPDFQGKGIGRQLLTWRLNEIKKLDLSNKVIVRTSQIVYRYYEKAGFNLAEIKKDYWAPGFDLYLMKLEIA